MPTAFYRHFDSVEQLGLALVDASFASLREMMREARREWVDIDAVITLSVSVLARNVKDRPGYFTFMFRERMSGNLCRCGAYPNIVDAICQAAGDPPPDRVAEAEIVSGAGEGGAR